MPPKANVSLAGKVTAKAWVFASSSGSGKYQTILYTDGFKSCNCRGWTQRIDAAGNRSCRHTIAVDTGTADQEAESFIDYTKTKGVKMEIPGVSMTDTPATAKAHDPRGSNKRRLAI